MFFAGGEGEGGGGWVGQREEHGASVEGRRSKVGILQGITWRYQGRLN